MLCMACESRDAETDGLLCGVCRTTVDTGLDGAATDDEVFNCVADESVQEPESLQGDGKSCESGQ